MRDGERERERPPKLRGKRGLWLSGRNGRGEGLNAMAHGIWHGKLSFLSHSNGQNDIVKDCETASFYCGFHAPCSFLRRDIATFFNGAVHLIKMSLIVRGLQYLSQCACVA